LDRKQYDALLTRIYDCALEPKAWVAVVEMLERLLAGSAVSLSLPHPREGEPGALIGPSFEPAFAESYLESYFAIDPLRSEAGLPPKGSFVSGRDVIAGASLTQASFYREWMKPQGLLPTPFVVGTVAHDEVYGTALLSFFQRAGAPRFRVSAAFRLGELLMPHLQRVVRIHFRKTQLDAERCALRAAFDRVPLGMILVDRRSKVRAMNRAAERILAQHDGLALDREGLCAAGHDDACQLTQLLSTMGKANSNGTPDRGEALRLTRPSGRAPLEALVMRVDAAEASCEPTLSALFVSDPEETAEPPHELLRRLYSLTGAEAALAAGPATGRPLADVAQHLGITLGTARQRLGQIFAKTSTHRQAGLVRRLLSGPAQLSAEE
jgi:PAS domain-containing protein